MVLLSPRRDRVVSSWVAADHRHLCVRVELVSSKDKSDLLGSVLITEPLERLSHDNDVANLIEYSESLQEDVASNMLPRQLSALEDRRRIAEKLIELRQDEISFKFGVISKIDILMTKCSFNLKHNMDQSGFRDELVEFSNHYVSDPDLRIRTQALIGLLNDKSITTCLRPPMETFYSSNMSLTRPPIC